MQIRREDEELIHSLRLVGAGLGTILAVLVVFSTYNHAKGRLAEQRQYVQQKAPLQALAGSQLMFKNAGQSNKIVDGLLENVKQAQFELDRLEDGFWGTLPLAGLVGMSAAASVVGFAGGYCSIWLLSWIGTISTIKLIRSIYKVIRRIRPEFDGGDTQIDDRRDKARVLPSILKLSVIVLIGLAVLATAVYWFTG